MFTFLAHLAKQGVLINTIHLASYSPYIFCFPWCIVLIFSGHIFMKIVYHWFCWKKRENLGQGQGHIIIYPENLQCNFQVICLYLKYFDVSLTFIWTSSIILWKKNGRKAGTWSTLQTSKSSTWKLNCHIHCIKNTKINKQIFCGLNMLNVNRKSS